MKKTAEHKRMIKPGATIGVLGGGQLGRMMALAGRACGYRFITLDPTEDCPGAQVSDRQITASYDDVEGAMELAASSDVITYEFENVDAKVADILEEQSYVPQGSRLLRTTQNRIHEKSTLASFGIPVAPFRVIANAAEAGQAAEELGLPLVMKIATGGYDGKGQRVIRRIDEIAAGYEALEQSGAEIIVEQFIPFTKEISVIAARSVSGEIQTFPVAENIHRDNILHLSIVPARVEADAAGHAEKLAADIAEKLDVVGLIAVEMFVKESGELVVNELAPRPHNSGHYTMDACVTSQFEQHIRAICDLPLGSARLLSPVVMVNILGEHLAPVLDKIEELPRNAKLHLYGKKDSKPKRKMGHINIVSESIEQALQTVQDIGIWNESEER